MPFLPISVRHVLGGDTKTYVTAISQAECVTRLEMIMGKSQLRPQPNAAIGETDAESFLFRMRGGPGGDLGPALYLYGNLQSDGIRTLIHVRRALPRNLLYPLAVFLTFGAGVSAVNLYRLVSSSGASSTEIWRWLVLSFALPVVALLITAMCIALENTNGSAHFDLIAELLDAQPVAPGSRDDIAPLRHGEPADSRNKGAIRSNRTLVGPTRVSGLGGTSRSRWRWRNGGWRRRCAGKRRSRGPGRMMGRWFAPGSGPSSGAGY
jgi:hypothetical protein